MLHGGVQRCRVPPVAGVQEGSRRVRALSQGNAAVGRLIRRVLSGRGRIYPGTAAQAFRHRCRRRDLGQAARAGRRIQIGPRTRSRVSAVGRHRESSMTRQVGMVGSAEAQNCTNLPSSWRHPESRDDSMSADYYQEIARILESGKFHMAFFDDRLAMPDRYGNDHRHTVEYGIRCVKMDSIVVLTTMGMVTENLALASTCSTPYFEPFDVARRFPP